MARQRPTYSVKLTPVESIYLLLENSRHTYAADYHNHAPQTDAPLSAH